MKIKNKVSGTDFEAQNLPHHRGQLFVDVIKLQWRKLFLMGFLVLVGFLPVIIVLFYRDNYIANITANYLAGNITLEMRQKAAKTAHFYTGLLTWALTYVAIIPLAGAARIYRQLAWNEPVFIKEDFQRGIKDNYRIAAICSTIFGFVLIISKLIIVLSDNILLPMIPVAIFLACIFPMLLIAFFQSTIYQGNFKTFMKNAFLIFIRDALRIYLFSLMMLLPLAFNLIETHALWKYGLIIAYILFLFPLTYLAFAIFSNYLFDKYINHIHYPHLSRKGLYRPSKDV